MGLHLFWERSAQLFWVFGLKRMASWGVGMCVFKGGGGSADLLVTWYASMTIVGTFLWLKNAWEG